MLLPEDALSLPETQTPAFVSFLQHLSPEMCPAEHQASQHLQQDGVLDISVGSQRRLGMNSAQ